VKDGTRALAFNNRLHLVGVGEGKGEREGGRSQGGDGESGC
jgi:hypothetical protein